MWAQRNLMQSPPDRSSSHAHSHDPRGTLSLLLLDGWCQAWRASVGSKYCRRQAREDQGRSCKIVQRG